MFHVIVDKYHAMRPDVSVLRHVIRTRPVYRKGGLTAWLTQPRRSRHEFLRGILQAHHENRALYLAIVAPGRSGESARGRAYREATFRAKIGG